MADFNLEEIFAANPITLDPGDMGYAVNNDDDSDAGYQYSQLMFNRYKLSVTISSNNLVVALVHEDGSAPSADRPLYFKIGDSLRSITAALSVTVNAGASTFNAGAAMLATLAQPFFVYLGWRAASSAVVIGISRIPYYSLYSDFNATPTNERYGAFSTAPASTDDVINIGYFEAINSGTASFNWSLPTLTSRNVKSYPIMHSNLMSYTQVWTNVTTWGTSTSQQAFYYLNRNSLIAHTELIVGTSPTITGDPTHLSIFGHPYSLLTNNSMVAGLARIRDNSVGSTTGIFAGLVLVNAGNVFFRPQSLTGSYLAQTVPSSAIPFTWAVDDTLGMDYRMLY